MKTKGIVSIVLSLFFLMGFIACGGSGGSGDGLPGTKSTGQLSLKLTDAATDLYQAVYVTIREVQIHIADPTGSTEGEWKVVVSPNRTFNLLELVNGVLAELGIADLNPGDYSQMRLIIGDTPDDALNIFEAEHPFANYVIDHEGEVQELKIPSAQNTGIKLVRGFAVEAEQTTELVLDFDALKSVVAAGRSGKWMLKPTVKVLDGDTLGTVRGNVAATDQLSIENIPLAGVRVSLQAGEDAEEEASATVTDEDGNYSLLARPGIYTLVATREGCGTTFVEGVSVEANVDQTWDIALDCSEDTGAVEGQVTVEDGDDEAVAQIRIQMKTQDENGEERLIDVALVNIGNGGYYKLKLPLGEYVVVALSADGEILKTYTGQLTIDVDGIFFLDIVLKKSGTFELPDPDMSIEDQLKNKVMICHKGKAITVSVAALPAHLGHGDAVGPCGEDAVPDDTIDGDMDDLPDNDIVDDAVNDTPDGDAEMDSDIPEINAKVTVCHNGKSLTISTSSLQDHLAHGDTEGACNSIDPSKKDKDKNKT